MILERATHPQFVSNTYLLADGRGGPAFFVDAGGPVESLIAVAERHELEPSHVLLTHHHFDHVSEVGKLRERWPDLVVLIHPLELEGLGEIAADPLEAGELLSFGALEVRPLRTPGHTAGMLSFLVSETAPVDRLSSSIAPASPRAAPGGFAGADALVFTGDTLFARLRRRRAGARSHHLHGPARLDHGHADGARLPTRASSPATRIRPRWRSEWEENPFIRVWRGLDQEGAEPCIALGEPATLVLLGADYDGGHKAWVRWPDGSRRHRPGLSRAATVGRPRIPGDVPRESDKIPTSRVRRTGDGRRARGRPGGQAVRHPRGERRPRRARPPKRRSPAASSRPPSRSSRCSGR